MDLQAEAVFEDVAAFFVCDPDPNGFAGAQSDIAFRRFPRRLDRCSGVDDVGGRNVITVHFLNGISALCVLGVQFEGLFVLRVGMIGDLAQIAHVDLLAANRASDEMLELACRGSFMSVPDYWSAEIG
ncbi:MULTISPECIES: hypothetical protein [unclassified Mesorhizobium]|uniref:hypothetical protein n=1 Tax=unclassified Mesorhizobium TaxID=325217 RepID=UPI00163D7B50|nr:MULTISPECIES: hypothetical protein [unclassified Mesorhizobium]